MYAVYRGRLARVTEVMGNPHTDNTDPELTLEQRMWNLDGVVLDDELWASFMDPDLIVDPTDTQVAEASGRHQ